MARSKCGGGEVVGRAWHTQAAGSSWGTEMAASVSQGVLSLWPYLLCAYFILFYFIIGCGPYYQPTPQIVLCNRLWKIYPISREH